MALFLTLGQTSPLEAMVRAVRSHRAVSGTLRSGRDVLRFRFLAPNRFWISGTAIQGTVSSDGTTAWIAFDPVKAYGRTTAARAFSVVNPVVGFNLLLRDPTLDPLRALRTALIDQGPPLVFDVPRLIDDARDQLRASGVSAQGLVSFGPAGRVPRRMVLYLDPKSNLPTLLRVPEEEGRKAQTYAFEDVVLDPPSTDADFRFLPPLDYQEFSLGPRPLAPPPRPLSFEPPVLTPGVWVQELRVGARFRRVGSEWYLDVETRRPGDYDLKGMTATVRYGREWSIATVVSKGERTLVSVPAQGVAPPDAVRLDATPRKSWPRVFLFEWARRP